MGQNQRSILVIYFLFRYHNLKVGIAVPPSEPSSVDKGEVTRFSHLNSSNHISVMLAVLS